MNNSIVAGKMQKQITEFSGILSQKFTKIHKKFIDRHNNRRIIFMFCFPKIQNEGL